MLIEKLQSFDEFEHSLTHEVERKFMPLYPERLADLRAEATPIEQFYLSHPEEAFSLRLREELEDGELHYTATLKTAGEISDDGIDRMEITAPISPELYQFYKDETTPVMRKLRAEPLPGITIDFFEDGSIQLESENPNNWEKFVEEHGDIFVETTGDRMSSNEWKAHLTFRRANEGNETLSPKEDLSAAAIMENILNEHARNSETPVIVHIGGRSGSGKSTIVRELESKLAKYETTPLVISTDDYHRGTSWLTAHNNGALWTKWDDEIVYDLEIMQQDIASLLEGKSISSRSFDWTTAEPRHDGERTPRAVIIIEGIYANSPKLLRTEDLNYETTTGLATCVGRRLLRDMVERPEFADPEKSLAYMLSEAEPAYRKQLEARAEHHE